MRFMIPKLSQFFHRRSKSDTALSRRLEPWAGVAPRRPLSTSFLDGLTHQTADTRSSLASEILARVPVTPVDLRQRPVSSTTLASANSASTQISAASHTVVVEVLTRRIQELEESVRTHEASAGLICSLQTELESSRLALREAEESRRELTATVAGLESSIARMKENVSGPATTHTTDNQHRKDDNRSLCSLQDTEEDAKTGVVLKLLSPGADRSVLDCALARVRAGEDPEDALVEAIKEAMAKPSNTWRTLLEPVVGQRAPEDYIAQVNCTLRARRETRSWVSKAAFWKYNAREDGRHADTVTPSASRISDVVKDLAESATSQPRSAPVSGAKAKPNTAKLADIAVQTSTQDIQTISPTPRGPTAEIAQKDRRDVASISQARPSDQFPDVQRRCDEPSPSLSRTSRSSEGIYTPNSARAASPYSNLPPLASVTFKESHSIRSLSSKTPAGGGLPSSASTSTQGSRLSYTRKSSPLKASARLAEDVVSPSLDTVEEDLDTQAALHPTSQDLPAPSTTSDSGSMDAETPARAGSVSSSASDATSGSTSIPVASSSDSGTSSSSWDRLSSFIARSFTLGTNFPETLGLTYAGAPSTTASVPAPVTAPAPTPTQAPVLAPRARFPPHFARAQDSDSCPSTDSSPSKKPAYSRLPVPISAVTTPRAKKSVPGAGLMKRLSLAISRPVLVDSTNIAAIDHESPVKPVGPNRPLRRVPERIRDYERETQGTDAGPSRADRKGKRVAMENQKGPEQMQTGAYRVHARALPPPVTRRQRTRKATA